MKNITASNCKFPKEHSDKNCVCGGHSSRDVKKKRKHNSTKRKLKIRIARKFKLKQQP